MTVSITMSNTTGGSQVEEVVDLGAKNPGMASDVTDLYIRHDALNNAITDCGFYIVRYSGSSYTGIADPDSDYDDVIDWGNFSGETAHGIDIDADADHGGLYINQNHTSSFPDASWHPFRTGYGSGYNNIIQLVQDSINIQPGSWTPIDGEIPKAGEAHIKIRWDVPQYASSAGAKFIQLVMAYSYTS